MKYLFSLLMITLSFNAFSAGFYLGGDYHFGASKFTDEFSNSSDQFEYGFLNGTSLNMQLGYVIVQVGTHIITTVPKDSTDPDIQDINMDFYAAAGATYLLNEKYRFSALIGKDYLISGRSSISCTSCDPTINETEGGLFFSPRIDTFLWEINPGFKMGLMASSKYYLTGPISNDWTFGFSALLIR